MKKMSRDGKSAKAAKGAARAPEPFRRFIPDARPMTRYSFRVPFWSKIWLSLR